MYVGYKAYFKSTNFPCNLKQYYLERNQITLFLPSIKIIVYSYRFLFAEIILQTKLPKYRILTLVVGDCLGVTLNLLVYQAIFLKLFNTLVDD